MLLDRFPFRRSVLRKVIFALPAAILAARALAASAPVAAPQDARPQDAAVVLIVAGEALAGIPGEAERILVEGAALPPGTYVRTKKGGSLVLQIGSSFWKLHPFSAAEIGGKPRLRYGKSTASPDPVFSAVRYFVSPKPAQGKCVRVGVSGDVEVKEISASISDRRGRTEGLRFFPLGNGDWRALLGFDAEARGDRLVLRIEIGDSDGDVTEVAHPFYLQKTAFQSGAVRLSEGSRALLEPSEEKALEREILLSILSAVSPGQLWNHTFRYPVDSPEVISQFGKIRRYYVNGSHAFTRSHRGTDIEGGLGDPVFAPNSGVVVFAGTRVTTGGTVVIDHGQGVFSLLFHMSAVLPGAGEYVVKGQRVGEIGATGIVEGAHLHWSVFVNGVYVDPLEWVERVF